MEAVLALVSASVVGAAVVLRSDLSPPPPRESPWDLAENARKMVTIAGSLAAFTITGVVLLLSFARQEGALGTPFSSAVGMFLVAFISLVASALMFGNLTRAGVVSSGVDVQTLQYSVTTAMFYRSIFLGWLALRPLVDAYGLDDLAEQIGWLVLFGAVAGGWTLSVALLHRLALVRARVVALVPVLAFAACGLVALVFELWLESSRSGTSALYLAYALFAVNVLSFFFYGVVPALLEHERMGPAIGRWWGAGMAVVAVVSSMAIGFIWLATAGVL